MIGFPLDRMAAQFFQMISRCYLLGSMILTSSKAYAKWANNYSHWVLAAPILDHQLHRLTTVKISGNSYCS